MAIHLDSVKFSLHGWVHDADEKDGLNSIRRWTNEIGDILTLHCFPEPDPSPFELGNEEAYREFSRQIAESNNSGLVEADLIPLGATFAYRSIHKYPQDPTGFTFVCGVSLSPHFVVNAQAAELGVTGIRETAVAEALGETADTGLIGRLLGRGERWSADPYDRKRGGMCFKSDAREWDSKFPDHPLSRVRNHLNDVLSSITLPE